MWLVDLFKCIMMYGFANPKLKKKVGTRFLANHPTRPLYVAGVNNERHLLIKPLNMLARNLFRNFSK